MLRIENREHLLVHAVSVIQDDSRYSLEHAGSQISLARGQDGHFTTSSLSSPQLIVFLMFFFLIYYIYIQRNNLQGPPIFQGKTMVSPPVRFSILSLISIHWYTYKPEKLIPYVATSQEARSVHLDGRVCSECSQRNPAALPIEGTHIEATYFGDKNHGFPWIFPWMIGTMTTISAGGHTGVMGGCCVSQSGYMMIYFAFICMISYQQLSQKPPWIKGDRGPAYVLRLPSINHTFHLSHQN